MKIPLIHAVALLAPCLDAVAAPIPITLETWFGGSVDGGASADGAITLVTKSDGLAFVATRESFNVENGAHLTFHWDAQLVSDSSFVIAIGNDEIRFPLLVAGPTLDGYGPPDSFLVTTNLTGVDVFFARHRYGPLSFRLHGGVHSGYDHNVVSISNVDLTSPVPEPAAIPCLLAGLAVLASTQANVHRRRRKSGSVKD